MSRLLERGVVDGRVVHIVSLYKFTFLYEKVWHLLKKFVDDDDDDLSQLSSRNTRK